MTTLREAATQALEALELGYDSAKAEADQYHAAMAGYRPQRHAQMDANVQQIAAAITALRAALAEPVQEPFGYLWPTGRHPDFRFTQQKLHGVDGMPVYASRAALAEPVQEPVAWMDIAEDGTKLAVRMFSDGTSDEVPLYLGCDHCNHPLYAAIKCRQCGRVTE